MQDRLEQWLVYEYGEDSRAVVAITVGLRYGDVSRWNVIEDKGDGAGNEGLETLPFVVSGVRSPPCAAT